MSRNMTECDGCEEWLECDGCEDECDGCEEWLECDQAQMFSIQDGLYCRECWWTAGVEAGFVSGEPPWEHISAAACLAGR